MNNPDALSLRMFLVSQRNDMPREFAGDCLAASELIASQAAKIEALTKDAQRLDFIASNARCDPKMDGQHVWWPTNFNHALRGPNLRAAIDAAIKAKETGA